MKFNLGLSMKSADESGYSVLRRFLLANRGLNITTAKIEKELMNFNRPLPEIDVRKLNRLATLAIEYEHAVLNESCTTKVRNVAPSSYRPLKHCPICARNCYHSYSFDLPWITLCPTHGVELSDVCPQCDNQWPKINELVKNNECNVCGTHVTRDQIVYSNAVTGSSKLRCHQEILESHSKLFPQTYLARQHENELQPTRRINQLSSFMLSVLQKNQSLSPQTQQYLRSLHYDFIAVNSASFELQEYEPRSDESWARIKRIALERVCCKVENILSRDLNHRVGECKHHPDRYCFHCEVWQLWCALVCCEDRGSIIKLSFQCNLALKNITFRHPLDIQPEYHGLISKYDSGTLKAYTIQPFAMADIYEQNLKTSFIGLYHFLRIRKMVKQIGNQTLVDLYQYLPGYTKSINFNCSPYLASFNERSVDLYWPQISLSASLTDPQSYFEPHIQAIKDMCVIDAIDDVSQQRD